MKEKEREEKRGRKKMGFIPVATQEKKIKFGILFLSLFQLQFINCILLFILSLKKRTKKTKKKKEKERKKKRKFTFVSIFLYCYLIILFSFITYPEHRDIITRTPILPIKKKT